MPIPSLSPEELRAALARLGTLPLNDAAKQQIAAQLVEAAIPDRKTTRRLPEHRAKTVDTTITRLRQNTRRVIERAAAALADLSDDDWDQLIADDQEG